MIFFKAGIFRHLWPFINLKMEEFTKILKLKKPTESEVLTQTKSLLGFGEIKTFTIIITYLAKIPYPFSEDGREKIFESQ